MQRRPTVRPATVAAGGARRDLDRGDRELLRVIDAEFDRAARAAAHWLACAPGCDACCHGPFPITPLDVRRLVAGLGRLERRDPRRAGAIRARAQAAVGRMAAGYPGDPDSGALDDDSAALDRFFDLHAALACPALDPRSGRCELYAWRPVSCRSYGPPARYAGDDLPPCDLCFRGAPVEVVERCRVEPDPDGIEQALIASLGVAPDDEWETLIAFALVR
ncbi:MAG TPA: YkgJ family cysteine cluster protein [Candidatus Polarisedimenticolaceae bacterium]|nr:YkgJ family cysteine cluster protein [Candidatus Polarisedimenticolaceae bacterium]